MNYNESDPAKRRIRMYLVDSSGDPVTGATLTGSDIQVSLSGNTFIDGSGTVTEIGDGVYYYQATQAETVTTAFVVLKVTDAAIKTFVWVEDIGVRIDVDESLSERRRLPIYLVDSAGDPVPGEDLDVVGTLEISINGAAFVATAGTWDEAGSGLYYYELTAAEVGDEGFVVLKVISAGTEPYVFSQDINDPADTVEVVDPGPDPIEAPITAADAEYTDHVLAAINRLPEYAKAKVSDS